MKHVAIDLGGKESQVCIRSSAGAILEEGKHPTKSLIARLQSWEPSRVIVETSAEAFRIADAAIAAGHEVRVVPATLVKTLGVGSRGVKNDQKDARVLSEVSCRIDLPSVHIPSKQSRELKSISGSREQLIDMRTALINNVRGWMRTQLWRVRSGATSSFAERVRGHATKLESPIPPHVERQLIVLDQLAVQIREADRQVEQFAKSDPTCRLLVTVPGVGPMTAVRFLAAIDRCERFATAHALQSYLGLTPGERSSSERERPTGITKAGPTATRRMLVQAAWSVWRRRPDEPMVRWATKIGERRGRHVAIVALARKLAGILFAIWRDRTSYRASRAAAPEATT